jgi:cytochrome c oxidase subunit 4
MVWGALLILTLVELWVAKAPMLKVAIIIALVSLALAKAALVAGYFMHLKFEKWALILVVLSPLVLSGILYIGLVPDATNPSHWLPPAAP